MSPTALPLSAAPRLLVFDSGIGGLSVAGEIRNQLPDVEMAYVADNRIFPYGLQAESVLIERVCNIMPELEQRFLPHAIVIACNSASTVVLDALRARTTTPVIGVVPAIKPAAAQSRNKVIGLLATPGTVNRRYTQQLIEQFAADCEVIRVGSSALVRIAENKLRGLPVDHHEVAAELAPFLNHPVQPDVIVLGCTHFPFLADDIAACLPAGTALLDSGAAIARRTRDVIALHRQTESPPPRHRFLFTAETAPAPHLAETLAAMDFSAPEFLHL